MLNTQSSPKGILGLCAYIGGGVGWGDVTLMMCCCGATSCYVVMLRKVSGVTSCSNVRYTEIPVCTVF